MLKISSIFRKTVLVVLTVPLVLVALPFTNAHASGLSDLNDPPAADIQQPANGRLEGAWARLQRVYERQGRILDRADGMIEHIQGLVDRMNENGKDTVALQAALDTYAEALKDAHPVYEGAKGIINSHQGFDADGKVTDREKAIETVKDLRDKLQEVRQVVGDKGMALRDAVQVFRKMNKSST